MIATCLAPLPFLIAASFASVAGSPLRVAASLPADVELLDDAEAAFTLRVDLAEGWTIPPGKVSQPIVQLQVPESVDLDGRRPTTTAELAQNEYLRAPFERLVEVGEETEISFSMFEDAAPGDAIRINVLVYATPGGEDATRLLRARYELPLQAGATARAIDPVPATWGEGDEYEPGDLVEGFALPRADGTEVDLDAILGRSAVVITTYRAFW